MQNHHVLRTGTEMDGNIPYLDGIRGMAILLVGIGHFFCEIYFFQIGWVGLNLFFILSGYLITRCLFQYNSYSAQGYFRNFYARRILRIFPLYYAVLIFFFLVLPMISQRLYVYFSGLGDMQSSYWLYTSNWNMIANGLPDQPLFFHFWSLAVEEQFYLVWPLLFFVCRSSKSKYIAISILLALSLFNRINTGVPLHAYLSTFTAAEPLLLGGLVCILQQDGILQQLAGKLKHAAAICAGILLIILLRDPDLHITNTWLIKYGYSAINIILLSVVVATVLGYRAGVQWQKLFSIKWLRWLGKYSYAIYIFHWIILKTIVYKLEAILAANQLPAPLAYMASRASGIALTLLVSYFSYNYFEARFLSLKKHFTRDKAPRWGFKWSFFFHRQAKPVQP